MNAGLGNQEAHKKVKYMKIAFISTIHGPSWPGSEYLWAATAEMLLAKGHQVYARCSAGFSSANPLQQLIGKGCGQTSRIDSLRQSIEKANQFKFDLQGAALASDAFFPFDDCVKIAHAAGITSFIQPGGSIRDKDSIEYCKQNNLAMVITGLRHFKH